VCFSSACHGYREFSAQFGRRSALPAGSWGKSRQVSSTLALINSTFYLLLEATLVRSTCYYLT
jgi:hypothetical protein